MTLLIAPAGVAAYCWLERPDPGPKDRPAATPKFKLTLVYNKEENAHLKHWFEDIIRRHADVEANPKNCPCRDGDKLKGPDGAPKFPGAYIVKFATKFPPDLVDTSKPKPKHLPPNMRITSGDLVRVAYTENYITEGAVPGLFLRMNAVQLVEKRALSHSHIAGQAFDEIEGFTVDDWHRIHEEGTADAPAEGDGTDF